MYQTQDQTQAIREFEFGLIEWVSVWVMIPWKKVEFGFRFGETSLSSSLGLLKKFWFEFELVKMRWSQTVGFKHNLREYQNETRKKVI